MKPDRNGTPTQRFGAEIGWTSPSQRAAAGTPEHQRCTNCHWSVRDSYTTGWGGCGSRLCCMHRRTPSEKGFVTKDNAWCKEWNLKLEDQDITKGYSR